MKVLCVHGSPRSNGNSSLVANQFLETARSLGAETRVYKINKLNYQGCQGCHACKTKMSKCILEDDLTEVLEAIREADILVFATSVYIRDAPGQFKCFVDRTFSYYKPDFHTNSNPSRLPYGKVLVFIITQAKPDEEKHKDVFLRYGGYFKRALNLAEIHLIRLCGVGMDGEKGVPEHFLHQAEEIARSLLKPPSF